MPSIISEIKGNKDNGSLGIQLPKEGNYALRFALKNYSRFPFGKYRKQNK